MSEVKTNPPSSCFRADRIQLQFYHSNHRFSRNAAGMQLGWSSLDHLIKVFE